MKGIIVTNYPMGCKDCNKVFVDICGIGRMSVQPWMRKRGLKPAWCPIKPMPEKKPCEPFTISTMQYERGFNDCIDLLGGQKDG